MSTILPANNIAILFATSDTDGAYWEIEKSNARPGPVSYIVPGDVVTLGPFSTHKHYEIQNLNIMFSEESIFVPSVEANVVEIADDADGVEIAAAVNGILAILIANGMMEAPE